jgi:hypothetical protein
MKSIWVEIQGELINLSACKFVALEEPEDGDGTGFYFLHIDGREIIFPNKKEAFDAHRLICEAVGLE